MKDKINFYGNKVKILWKERSKKQKSFLISVTAVFILILSAVSLLSPNSHMVQLYEDLSLSEVGQVKEELDARGITYEIGDGGTTISVPDSQAGSIRNSKYGKH